jgi:hypothetical protein
MLKTERPAWCDKDGYPVLPISPDDSGQPAPGWKWIDESWNVDEMWDTVDSDGWVYT